MSLDQQRWQIAQAVEAITSPNLLFEGPRQMAVTARARASELHNAAEVGFRVIWGPSALPVLIEYARVLTHNAQRSYEKLGKEARALDEALKSATRQLDAVKQAVAAWAMSLGG